MNKSRFILATMAATLLLVSTGLLSVESKPHTPMPFHRGVNLTGWFQTSNVQKIDFGRFTRQDFKNIKSLGADVIRLPISLQSMTNGAPSYTISPLFFQYLDSAVTWAEEEHISLIIDNHTFDPAKSTPADVESILLKEWKQLAAHYKNSSRDIYYEILNEPHGITNEKWGRIQGDVIDTIRTIDTKHTIVVGGADWNSYNDLAGLSHYKDHNLIYTFHFYDPMVFTHQGASWTGPSMVPLSGVPFPYNKAKVPPVPPSLKGSWVGKELLHYAHDGTVDHLKKLINIAVKFKKQRNVIVYCGEFGVYRKNSANPDRVFWYRHVRQYLEQNGIPWTIWDYKGGFGVFKKGSPEKFPADLNRPMLKALGFDVPGR